MNVLGIDTGRWLAWVLLGAVDGSGLAIWRGGGVLDVDALGMDGAIDAMMNAPWRGGAAPLPSLVAIETVHQVSGRGGPMLRATHADQLVRAARLGGRLEGYYEGLDVQVATPTADEVRAHYLGSAHPRQGGKAPDLDAALLVAAQTLIAGWPARISGAGAAYRRDGSDLLASHRCHVADAALAALYAARVGS